MAKSILLNVVFETPLKRLSSKNGNSIILLFFKKQSTIKSIK